VPGISVIFINLNQTTQITYQIIKVTFQKNYPKNKRFIFPMFSKFKKTRNKKKNIGDYTGDMS
jgi:hypothetical protein